ncbi:lysophospholipase I [Mycena pura]|uniref:Acyl-protein thioesterase 1 n=1 Tax=Mycena pura TaxID=153505 RepID=A0AAD6YQB8_9AGAR|nr:lysophospholipase I [Mycena pura]
MLPIARKLRSYLHHVQFILPAAPVRILSANEQQTTAWFDLNSFNLSVETPGEEVEDEEGILQSMASLDTLLSELEAAAGLDPSRIILGGFSQGAAMTLLTGLTTAKRLAGLFVLSGRLPLRHKFASMVSPHAASLPIFWGHGTADPLVTHDLGHACAQFVMSEIGVPAAPKASLSSRILDWLDLKNVNADRPAIPTGLSFRSYYGLRHEIGVPELDDLVLWLSALLPPRDS